MSDRSERLFEAMSELSEEKIDEGAAYIPKKTFRWKKRWTALAACVAVVLLGVGTFTGRIPLLQIGGSSGGGGHGDGASTFMSYAGPVFPLTLREENGAISAQRSITLDFAPWVPVWVTNEEKVQERTDLDEAARQEQLEWHQEHYPQGGRYEYSSDILVKDAYTLTNTAQEEQTISVLYPFASSLYELGKNRPTLTVDGAQLDSELYVGTYSGSFEGAWDGTLLEGDLEGSVNLDYAESWEDYRDLLEDGSYLRNALGEAPDVSDVPVIVYRFTDPYGPEADEEAGIPNPSLRVSFDLDYEKTAVLSYGFHFAKYDRENGAMVQGFSIPTEDESRYGRPFYLIIVGEDVENMTVGGYVTGGSDEDTQVLEGCGVDVERYESDLDTILREILLLLQEDREIQFSVEEQNAETGLDAELYYRAFLEHLLAYGVLSQQGAERYGSGQLSELASDVGNVDRVCWLEAQVTIPAGGSVTLTAEMQKEGSYDFYCTHSENRGVQGYDLVTTLGSNLICTEQKATLEAREQIQIVRQNFGFDLEHGVTTVALDPDIPHYYLEVKRLTGSIPETGPET